MGVAGANTWAPRLGHTEQMKSRTALTATGVVVALLWNVSSAFAQEDAPNSGGLAPHAEDHVMVEVAPGFTADAVIPDSEGAIVGRWREVLVPAGMTADAFVEGLRGLDGISRAEVDPIVQVDPVSIMPLSHLGSVSVNDPFKSFQWHFPAIQLETAWAESTGDGVVVAVVDSGISPDGEDLACQTFVSPYNAITQTMGVLAASDDHGHGTHVAGTVAQCTNNGVGVAGVAFNAALMPVKVLNSGGNGLMSDVAAGIDWARTHGADVINLSLGCVSCSSSLVEDAIDAAVADGVVVVVAAGNENAGSVDYPASNPKVIAVGATDFNDLRAPYSNRGGALDVVAPGGDLNQDANGDLEPDGVLQETFTTADGFGYYWFQGTSMAAPHVSGAAALLISKHPGIDPATVKKVLEDTALDLGPVGFDTSYGHGLIQVHDALMADIEPPRWANNAIFRVVEYGETSLKIAWTGATDNVAVTDYLVRLLGTTGSMVASSPTTMTGLSPGRSLVFEVLAFDAAGHWSEPLTRVFRTPRHFTDTQENIFYPDILWMSGRNITTGCNPPEDDRFCPDDFVTRGQLAAFLARALGLSDRLVGRFADDDGSVFEADIEKLAASGITSGCNPPDNDEFCPAAFVTRGQLAAFLARALGLSDRLVGRFADDDGSVFEADIEKLAASGITSGCNPPVNDHFCPDRLVTRGELAAFLHRGDSLINP